MRSHKRAPREWFASQVRVYRGHLGRSVVHRLVHNLALATDDLSAEGLSSSWARALPELPLVHLLPVSAISRRAERLMFSCPSDVPPCFSDVPTLSSTMSEVTAFIRHYQDVALSWVHAAVRADAITAATVQKAISDTTVQYAFGEAPYICIDSLATPTQRADMDTLLAQLLALVDWNAPHAAYLHRWDSTAHRTVRSGEVFIDGSQWWIASQIPAPVWIAYDGIESDVFSSDDPVGTPIRSAFDVYGDDAGDIFYDLPLVPLRKDLRVAEIIGVNDVVQLIERYPARFADDAGLHAEWAGTDAPISCTLDWVELAKDYDGVRLSVPAALEVSYVPLRVRTPSEHTAMLTGWTPGSTVYLCDPRVI